jgi:hypothetical protein
VGAWCVGRWTDRRPAGPAAHVMTIEDADGVIAEACQQVLNLAGIETEY